MSGDTPDGVAPALPTVRVSLVAYGREVTVEAAAGLSDVTRHAFSLWTWTGAAGDLRPRVEAGGMGFETERAGGPVFGDDCPGTVRA